MKKDVSKFHERLKDFHTYYSYHQKWLREEADKAAKTNDIATSLVYNVKADIVAEMVGHAKNLVTDFEDLIATGQIVSSYLSMKEKQ